MGCSKDSGGWGLFGIKDGKGSLRGMRGVWNNGLVGWRGVEGGAWGLIGLEMGYYEGVEGFGFIGEMWSENYCFVGLVRIKSLGGLEQ